MEISKKAMLCGLAGVAGFGMITGDASASWTGGHHEDDRSDEIIPVIEDGEYLLCNHPDGNRAEPYYGMVLSNLYRPKGSRTFTFDFEHDLSDVRMSITGDGSSIHISGDVYGGRDIGDVWADDSYKGLYHIDFTYDSGVRHASDDDDIEVRWPSSNTGSILTPLGDTFDLFDKSKKSGRIFRLGDKSDDNGYRGFDGISGWGWLKGDPDNRRESKIKGDFLFTVKPVPAPGTAVLGGLGLVCFTGRRRRDEK